MMIFKALFTTQLLDVVLILVSAYIVFKAMPTHKVNKAAEVYYHFAVANLLFTISSLLAGLHRNDICLKGETAGYIIYLFMLFALAGSAYSWFIYVESYLEKNWVDTYKKDVLWAVPLFVFAVLCFIPGLIFSIDSEGIYHVGSLYIVQYVVCFGYCIVAMISSAVNYFRTKKRNNKDRLLFKTMIIALVAIIVQLLVEDNMMPVAITMIVLISYINVYDAEVEQVESNLEQNYSRIFALEDTFESLYDVELESGNYVSYVRGDFYQSNVIDKLVTPTDYFEDLRANIDAVIYEEDREGLYNTLTRNAIRKELRENEHFDYLYRVNTENGPVWFRMRIVYKDIYKQNVIIGVFNAENDVETKQLAEQKALAEEALVFTNFFLDTYVSAYYVNMDTFSCQVYKRTDDLEKEYPIITNYLDSTTDYINNDVHPDDRARMLEIIQPGRMRAMLAEHPVFSEIFRDISGGTEKTYRMQVIRGSEEGHAAFGFIDITNEINEQNKRMGEAEEYKKLIESVAASYDIAYAVDMSDDSYKLLKKNTQLLDDGSKFKNYSESKEAFFSIVHDSDKERMRHELDYNTIREKLKTVTSYNVEFRAVNDGSTSWHELNVTSIDADRIALGFVEKDIELTKLHLEEKRFEEYFALFVVDVDTGMLKVALNNEAYQSVPIGSSAPYTKTIQGFAQTLDTEAQEFFMQISDLEYVRKDLATDDKRTFSYKSTHLEGGKWIDVTTYVILRHDDGTPAMFTLGFGIVDALASIRQEVQKRFAEQNALLTAQQKELEAARDAAEAANRSKSDFLFNMSHDIRTPMNAITGFTNMAIKHIDDKEKVLDCLDKTQKAGGMLLSLINSVLEVSRIESGHATLEEQHGNVYYSFANIDTTLRELASAKNIDISFEYGDIKDKFVYVDFSRCMRIFVNVISNAIKYTPEGGRVKVRCEQCGLAENGYAKYRYTVEDNGIGMSEEFQKHIFEQFTRENTATVSGIQGTGLGMTVVKSFVDLMGGEITLKSKQGEGSTFTIILPFRLQEGEIYIDPVTGDIVRSAFADERAAVANFSGKKVLLVEDNELNREIAVDILEEEGLIVEEADDGTTAVEMMKDRGPAYYHFILMDIQMPKMNGFEATKAIRAMYPGAGIPIIALSANAFAEDRKAAIEAGMDAHVSKPINIQELFSALAKYLQ